MSGGADKAIEKLGRFIEKPFEAELILTDPKDVPSEENEAKLQAFCEKLKE